MVKTGARAFVGFIVVIAVTALAGGQASAAPDVTPPSITITTPAANGVYAQNSVVAANYSCSDASGVAACAGTVRNGQSIVTQRLGTNTFTVTAYDNAGNKATLTRSYTVTDQTGPVITISKPTAGAVYAKNSFQPAKFACYDTGVGLSSCVGSVANGSPLPTGTTGPKQFTVTATDLANNVTMKVINYQVV